MLLSRLLFIVLKYSKKFIIISRGFWSFSTPNGILWSSHHFSWNSPLHESRGFETPRLQHKVRHLVSGQWAGPGDVYICCTERTMCFVLGLIYLLHPLTLSFWSMNSFFDQSKGGFFGFGTWWFPLCQFQKFSLFIDYSFYFYFFLLQPQGKVLNVSQTLNIDRFLLAC